MRFLVDNQLPVALARFIEGKGFESRHVLDLQLDTATDREIWNYAKKNEFIVVSKDEDFFYLATADSSGPTLIWVRLGNCRKAALLSAFDGILPKLLEALSSEQRIIEIR